MIAEEEVRQERNSGDREEIKASAFISRSLLKASEAQLGHPRERGGGYLRVAPTERREKGTVILQCPLAFCAT